MEQFCAMCCKGTGVVIRTAFCLQCALEVWMLPSGFRYLQMGCSQGGWPSPLKFGSSVPLDEYCQSTSALARLSWSPMDSVLLHPNTIWSGQQCDQVQPYPSVG